MINKVQCINCVYYIKAHGRHLSSCALLMKRHRHPKKKIVCSGFEFDYIRFKQKEIEMKP